MELTQTLNNLLTTEYKGKKIIQQDKNKFRVLFFSFSSLEEAKKFIDDNLLIIKNDTPCFLK